jgi:hypothetical protein
MADPSLPRSGYRHPAVRSGGNWGSSPLSPLQVAPPCFRSRWLWC